MLPVPSSLWDIAGSLFNSGWEHGWRDTQAPHLPVSPCFTPWSVLSKDSVYTLSSFMPELAPGPAVPPMDLFFPKSRKVIKSHNQTCFLKKSMAIMRVIPPEFRCSRIDALRTGHGIETQRPYWNGPSWRQRSPKLVGSTTAFQNGNVNFLNGLTAFLRVVGKISQTAITDYTWKMFCSIFQSVFLSLNILSLISQPV